MLVNDLVDDALTLFMRLVSDPELRRRESRAQKPDLSPVVRQLLRKNVPIQRGLEVNVPIIDEHLKTDFAFTNGVRNLVKSVGISTREDVAIYEAIQLGSKGLLIAKHPDASGASKLVIVADIEDQQLLGRVSSLLDDHEVRLVDAQQLEAFALEIEREAH
jgi:hypothetical protein